MTKMTRVLPGLAAALLALSCSGDPAEQADVGVVQEALAEDACMFVPAPAFETTNNNIGFFGFDIGPNLGNRTIISPGYTYNPSGCPRQYIAQIQDNGAPRLGVVVHFMATPVWVADPFTSATCATARLNMTVWKYNGMGRPQWILPAIDSFTSTGHWENGDCVFRRDDNGSNSLTTDIYLTNFESRVRVAVQAKKGSNYHSVGLLLENDHIHQ